jgi:hypothetical protein
VNANNNPHANYELQLTNGIQPNTCYKPKKDSNPFNLLRFLYKLIAHVKPLPVEEVRVKYNKYVKQIQAHTFKRHMERLFKNHFIRFEEKEGLDSQIVLLDKGLNFITSRTVPKENLERARNRGKETEFSFYELESEEKEKEKDKEKSNNNKMEKSTNNNEEGETLQK